MQRMQASADQSASLGPLLSAISLAWEGARATDHSDAMAAASVAAVRGLRHLSQLDYAWLDYVCQRPWLATLLALALARFVPRLVSTLMRAVAMPTLILLFAWALLTHHVLVGELASAVLNLAATQPVITSRAVLAAACLMLAPSLLSLAGATAATLVLLALIRPAGG
jgi:hypothetical protein